MSRDQLFDRELPNMDTTFEVDCPPFAITLSHWDRICPPTHSKRLLCFATVPELDQNQIVEWLRCAFHQTVQEHPFLGGSVVPFDYGAPWLRNITCRGAARLRVRDLSAKLSFSKLSRANFPPALLKTEDLCTFTEVAYVTEEPVDVCAFTATFIEGGMILAVEVFHVVADAFGVTEMIKTFAHFFKLAESRSALDVFPAVTNSSVYRQDRVQTLYNGGNAGDLAKHSAYGSSPVNAFSLIQNASNSATSFRIESKDLVALKGYVSGGLGPGEWISTADAISALIWRSVILGRRRAGLFPVVSGQHDSDTTFLSQAVDFRQQLQLGASYLGNAVYMTKAALPTDVIADGHTGLAMAAKALRAEAKAVTAEKVFDFLGYIQQAALQSHTCVNIFPDLTTSGVILTNHFKFDLHAMDFGHHAFLDGKIQALRFPECGIMRGAIIVMPKLVDGSCEFLVTEFDATLAEMRRDEVFGRIARESKALDDVKGLGKSLQKSSING